MHRLSSDNSNSASGSGSGSTGSVPRRSPFILTPAGASAGHELTDDEKKAEAYRLKTKADECKAQGKIEDAINLWQQAVNIFPYWEYITTDEDRRYKAICLNNIGVACKQVADALAQVQPPTDANRNALKEYLNKAKTAYERAARTLDGLQKPDPDDKRNQAASLIGRADVLIQQRKLLDAAFSYQKAADALNELLKPAEKDKGDRIECLVKAKTACEQIADYWGKLQPPTDSNKRKQAKNLKLAVRMIEREPDKKSEVVKLLKQAADVLSALQKPSEGDNDEIEDLGLEVEEANNPLSQLSPVLQTPDDLKRAQIKDYISLVRDIQPENSFSKLEKTRDDTKVAKAYEEITKILKDEKRSDEDNHDCLEFLDYASHYCFCRRSVTEYEKKQKGDEEARAWEETVQESEAVILEKSVLIIEISQYAVRVFGKLSQPKNDDVFRLAECLTIEALIYNAQDKKAEAIKKCEQAMEVFKQLQKLNDEQKLWQLKILGRIASIYCKQDKLAEAITIYDKLREVFGKVQDFDEEKFFDERMYTVGFEFKDAAEIAGERQNDLLRAAEFLELAEGVFKKTQELEVDFADEEFYQLQCLERLADIYRRQKKWEKSIEAYERAAEIYGDRNDDDSRRSQASYLAKAAEIAYYEQNNLLEAAQFWARAAVILEENLEDTTAGDEFLLEHYWELAENAERQHENRLKLEAAAAGDKRGRDEKNTSGATVLKDEERPSAAKKPRVDSTAAVAGSNGSPLHRPLALSATATSATASASASTAAPSPHV